MTGGPGAETAPAGDDERREERVRRLYAAFNARDLDAVLDQLAEDVSWPNAWEGGRVNGRAAVRA
jgi:ketosteroid isomerase-like protein